MLPRSSITHTRYLRGHRQRLQHGTRPIRAHQHARAPLIRRHRIPLCVTHRRVAVGEEEAAAPVARAHDDRAGGGRLTGACENRALLLRRVCSKMWMGMRGSDAVGNEARIKQAVTMFLPSIILRQKGARVPLFDLLFSR